MKYSPIAAAIMALGMDQFIDNEAQKLSKKLKPKWYKVQLTKEQRKGKTFGQLQELKKEIYLRSMK